VLIDDRGRTRPAALQTLRPLVDVVRGGCTPTRRTADEARLSFPVVRGEALLVRLDYYATDDLDLYLTAAVGHDKPLPWRLPGWPPDRTPGWCSSAPSWRGKPSCGC
jgi:hypothetical protein